MPPVSMLARVVTCRSCGAATRLPAEHWDEQAEWIDAWFDQHALTEHEGAAVRLTVDPDPLHEPVTPTG
jgi:hypothetical protein